ncbi:RNA-directed DNA polymerase [Dyadobacter sandarakinus]|uniref:RNA-directed DNA polymerase n=1 Tax=Dyadobacter sandarakinus TaxID=2747268 RepID=A0ABX7I0F4_9BACT|nr:RNA-directed DNA polymerase [Dyadobacter sandarakinus]QRQ99491.1 RNA-directed DNA polymerase [Dyadobacter sandarakinus]
MTLFDIINRGFFPKELPPPFTTDILAKHVTTILSKWSLEFKNNTTISSLGAVVPPFPGESKKKLEQRKKLYRDTFISKYSSSKGCTFSISKGKLSRRFLQIPNPKHFILLSDKIVSRWGDFEKVFALSHYSESYPIAETSSKKRSVSTYSKSVSDFHNRLLSTSIEKKIEVKVDISKFYPTIYTHTIAWALLGKEKAKSYFNQKSDLDSLIAAGDLDAALYKNAEDIDNALRSCQERQSIGIPIGPDTSHVIAEAVACRIDSMLQAKFGGLGLKACRYYDDYYLYVSTKDEADTVLKGLQLILSDFQLEINESKIKIREFPFSFEDEFTTTLFLFDFKKTNQANSLKHYFSVIWGFAEKNPKRTDWIFKYSLRIFEFGTVKISKETWRLFENLLLKTVQIDPSILDIVTRILLTYTSYVDYKSKDKWRSLINIIIKEHSQVNHNFEVSWALWLAKSFNLEIEESCANLVINTKDCIANLILLDLLNTTSLVQGNANINQLEIELKDDVLFSSNWLLAYEAVKKGWLVPADSNLLNSNLFFKIIQDLDVEFYDSKKQLIPYNFVEKVDEITSLPTSYDGNVNVSDATSKPSEVKKKAIFKFIETIPSGLDF